MSGSSCRAAVKGSSLPEALASGAPRQARKENPRRQRWGPPPALGGHPRHSAAAGLRDRAGTGPRLLCATPDAAAGGGGEAQQAGEGAGGSAQEAAAVEASGLRWVAEQSRLSSSAGLQAQQQQELVAQAAAAPPPVMPPWSSAGFADGISGWAVAMALLTASRISRGAAAVEALRAPSSTDWTLQQGRRKSLSSNPEVLARQREYDAKYASQRQAQAAQGLEEAKRREAAERKTRMEREQRYREEAEKETARLRAELEAQKREFQEKEAAMAAELAERVEKEKAILEEQQAKRRAELEARRLAKEEEERQRAAAAALEEQKRQEELAEARRLAKEEAEKLRKMAKSFAVTMEGTVTVAPPEPGTLTEGPLEREAILQVDASFSSAIGGPGSAYRAVFATVDDAVAGASSAIGAAARSAADAYISAVRLQAMTGMGVLQHMDDPELQHWMRIACYRAECEAMRKIDPVLRGFSVRRSGTTTESLTIRTQRRVLPEEHPKSCRSIIEAAITKIEAGDVGDVGNADVDDDKFGPNGAARVLLRMMVAEEEEMQADSCTPLPHGGEGLVLAHFVDRLLDSRPAKQSDAPGWFEAGVGLSRRLLATATKGAEPDSLVPVSNALQNALPEEQPIAAFIRELAQKNLSPLTRAKLEEKQRIIEAELQQRLLKEEWPDREELAAARMAEIEANTPIAERCWALRNVAGSLAMGGPGEQAKALKMLRRATKLKEEHYKSALHPGLLVELEALGSLLAKDQDMQQEAADVAEQRLEIAGLVAARMAKDGDEAGAAVLQAGAAAELAEILGDSNETVVALSTKGEEALSKLPAEEAQKAVQRLAAGGIMKELAKEFTEELGAYSQGKKSKVELWRP